MNRMMSVLLALGVVNAALAGPDVQADIQAYHDHSMQAYRDAALRQIREDLLQDLAQIRWDRRLDPPLRELSQAGPRDAADGLVGGSARLHLEP